VRFSSVNDDDDVQLTDLHLFKRVICSPRGGEIKTGAAGKVVGTFHLYIFVHAMMCTYALLCIHPRH